MGRSSHVRPLTCNVLVRSGACSGRRRGLCRVRAMVPMVLRPVVPATAAAGAATALAVMTRGMVARAAAVSCSCLVHACIRLRGLGVGGLRRASARRADGGGVRRIGSVRPDTPRHAARRLLLGSRRALRRRLRQRRGGEHGRCNSEDQFHRAFSHGPFGHAAKAPELCQRSNACWRLGRWTLRFDERKRRP